MNPPTGIVRAGLALAILLLVAGAPDVRAEEGLELEPYAVASKAVRGAAREAAAGRLDRAARRMRDAGKLPEASRAFLEGVYLRQAGKLREWRKAFAAVARSDSPLGPAAAMALADDAVTRKRPLEARELYGQAAGHPAWCGAAWLAIARLERRAGDEGRVRQALEAALPCLPGTEARSAAVLELAPTGVAESCRPRLLHQRYFWGGGEDAVLRDLRPFWPDESDDLALLRLLLRGRTSSWRRELRALPASGADFRRAMLNGLVAKQRRREAKAEALVFFDQALRLASSGLRQGMALYFKGRTLESLDRDLLAIDVYRELADRHPDFPLNRRVARRVADIAVREGQPVRGIAALQWVVETACPGEDLAEMLWLSGFVNFLGGDWEEALRAWKELARGYFLSEQSRWVFYGPMGLFWQGKAHLAAGRRDEAERLWKLVARLVPGDYYGVLAGRRLTQLGIEVEPPAPARLDRSPLELPGAVELPPEYAPAAELFRLGLWREAHEVAATLAGRGIVGPSTGDLLAATWTRTRGLQDGIAFRRTYGMLPAPWRQGSRLWRSSLPLDYVEAIRHGHAAADLDSALTAAIIRFESNFNPKVHSTAGAIGLLQVKTNTGNHVAVPCLGQKPVRRRDLQDPMRNLELGSIYVRELIHRHHDNWAVALAAYNAGPGAAAWWLSRFAGLNTDAFVEQITYPNTVGYVKRILGVTPIYWSLFFPALSSEPMEPGLPLTIPEDVRPFLDESGGRCDPRRKP